MPDVTDYSKLVDEDLYVLMGSVTYMRSPTTKKRGWFAMRLNGQTTGQGDTARAAMLDALKQPVPDRKWPVEHKQVFVPKVFPTDVDDDDEI